MDDLARRNEVEELKAVARETIDEDPGGGHASVAVPGQSRPHQPAERAQVVDEVLDDPRIEAGTPVTVTVPMGDVHALKRVREKLDDDTSRPTGATVIVEGKRSSRDPERRTAHPAQSRDEHHNAE